MPESLYKLQRYWKRDSGTGVFLWILQDFKNTSFTEYLMMTASILQQLLALYFAIIHSWQLSSSEKSLVGKKIIHISQGFYRFRCFFPFSLTNICLAVFVGSETPKHNAFDQFWKFKFHFDNFPRKT